MKRQFLAVATTCFALSACNFTLADINITLSPLPGGNVLATGVGSGVVSGGNTSGDWDYNDFSANFLSAGTESASTETITGSFVNVTTNTSFDLQSFQVDEDGDNAPGDDDIDIDTLIDAVFTAGDQFTFNMTAIFPVTPIGNDEALLYADLIPGTYTAAGGGGDGAENIFGVATITVVPEPFSLSAALMAGVFFVGRWRRD